LLGRTYLMLRRAIRRYPRGSCHPKAATALRIVVTFGGSDPVGATVRTLQLIPPGRPSEIFVLAGPGFRDDEALRTAATAATAAGHTVEIIRDPEDPAELFVSADAAICSAGGTLGELAYLGCPALGFAIAPDQVASARAQVDAGLIAGGHAWASLDDDTLRSQLQAFFDDDGSRRDHRQRALATADEFGSRRIVAEAIS
jgi:spore coat polysaccharide biosynthesis predicted glycosyltransferase SpsG